MASILAIDTSHEGTSVALKLQDGTVVEKENLAPSSHSESLSSLVRELLRGREILGSDNLRLVIGSGPGSFTGLRIGYGFMKGLALSYRSPLIEVSSFEASALSIEDDASIRIITSDARRGESFLGVYKLNNEKLSTLSHPTIVPVADIDRIVDKVRADTGQTPRVFPFRSSGVSKALIELSQGGQVHTFSIAKLSDARPLYIREVAAKTLKERGERVWGE